MIINREKMKQDKEMENEGEALLDGQGSHPWEDDI